MLAAGGWRQQAATREGCVLCYAYARTQRRASTACHMHACTFIGGVSSAHPPVLILYAEARLRTAAAVCVEGYLPGVLYMLSCVWLAHCSPQSSGSDHSPVTHKWLNVRLPSFMPVACQAISPVPGCMILAGPELNKRWQC